MNASTFDKYKERADFFVVSEPDLFDIKKPGKTQSISNGIEFPNPKFVVDHDIFHYAVDLGLIHKKYKERTGIDLDYFDSNCFHGESIIELCTRFFGNLNNELLIVKNASTGLIQEEYIELPKIQPGVNHRQPKRIFPIFLNFQNLSNLEDSNKTNPKYIQYLQTVDDYMRYVIVGSLVSGNIADRFLDVMKQKYGLDESWMYRKFFYSDDFKQMVHKFIKDPNQALSLQLRELDLFLRNEYKSSLERTVQYCQLYLEVFYTVFLNSSFDQIYETENSYLFPAINQEGQMTLMSYLFFLNRSTNLVYKGGIESLSFKEQVKTTTRNSLKKNISRVLILEKEYMRLENMLAKITANETKHSRKILLRISSKKSCVSKQSERLIDGIKEQIHKNMEKSWGFCRILDEQP